MLLLLLLLLLLLFAVMHKVVPPWTQPPFSAVSTLNATCRGHVCCGMILDVHCWPPPSPNQKNRCLPMSRCLQSREMTWQSKASAEASLLLKEQLRLEKDTGQALFVGLSLADTLTACIKLNQPPHTRAIAALRKAFAVPETRWYWIKLRALATGHDWLALEVFAAEKKVSPIGWEPFLQVAAQNGAPQEVQSR
jgi:hypothetical protein